MTKGSAVNASDVEAWGIDLGTTNSTLCRVTGSSDSLSAVEPQIVEVRQPTAAGEFVGGLVPSMVACYQSREFVGQGAKDLRAIAADKSKNILRNVNLFYECKNEIGTSRTYPNAPERYRSPTDIAERILSYLRREGIGDAGGDKVVVTIPASFQAAQRAETVAACRRAGLDVRGGRLLDEPVAAFIDYAFRYNRGFLESVAEAKRLLVFDFGGGTCDIALFDLERADGNTPVRVASRAVSRFHRLGGGDIDLAILHRVLMPQLCSENRLSDFAISFQNKAQVLTPALIAVAEALKIQLCGEMWRLQQFGKLATMRREDISARHAAQIAITVDGTRLTLSNATLNAAQFDEVLAPFIDTEHLFARSTEYRLENSIFAPIADALDRAESEPSEIDYVLAVGGSSQIPPVIDALRGYFQRAHFLEYEAPKDPQLAVARGASLQALALATTGRGIIEPVAQDDIFLRTQQGDLKLIVRGSALPIPAGASHEHIESLTVPQDAFAEPLRLSVELVAGAERRPLFSDHWDLRMVSKGSRLRLEYAYDENQVLKLALRLADFPESLPFETSVENPLSHVVNPNRSQEEIDSLEEQYRRDPTQSEELMPRIAELCADLGQYEKAIAMIRGLLRKANRPIAWLLNRQAMYEEGRGNHEAAIRCYGEAARASKAWGGPLFNLALLHERQRNYDEALSAIDRACEIEDGPPYRTLKFRIEKHLRPADASTSKAARILGGFGPAAELDDWELGWFIAAAEMAGDAEARHAGTETRRGRQQQAKSGGAGVRPNITSAME